MKSENIFVENYRSCWRYFKESRWFIVSALIIFSAFFILGFIFPLFFREKIFELMEMLRQSMSGLSTSEVICMIFFNNIKVAFFAIFLGIVLGIFPIIIGVINGYLAGFVSREVAGVVGIGILWRLVPHGIFEIPAILFSIGIGMRLGLGIFSRKRNRLKYNLIESARFFVFVIFPLLLIAAIVEGILIWLL